MTTNPHDRLFKAVFSNPDNTGAHLEVCLSPALFRIPLRGPQADSDEDQPEFLEPTGTKSLIFMGSGRGSVLASAREVWKQLSAPPARPTGLQLPAEVGRGVSSMVAHDEVDWVRR